MVVLVYPKILKKGRCFWVKGIDLFGWLNVSFFRVFFETCIAWRFPKMMAYVKRRPVNIGDVYDSEAIAKPELLT